MSREGATKATRIGSLNVSLLGVSHPQLRKKMGHLLLHGPALKQGEVRADATESPPIPIGFDSLPKGT